AAHRTRARSLHGPVSQRRAHIVVDQHSVARPHRRQRRFGREPDVLFGPRRLRPEPGPARDPHAQRGAAMMARIAGRLLRISAVVALCAMPARGGGSGSQLSVTALHVLTSIDSLPSKDELVTVFAPDSALERLKQIIGPASSEELGVQLRAIRAL